MYLLASGEFADAVQLVKQYGPFFLAVIFFLWRDWKREDRLSARIDVLEDEQRKVILPLVHEYAAVITRNSTTMERSTHVMERLERALDR